jgi:hypothetical protein
VDFLRKNWSFIIALILILGAFYTGFDNIMALVKQKFQGPCFTPLSYSIGAFDKKFGITENEFLADIRAGEEVWEKAYGKELFVYDPEGELKVNLIYDYRQQATDRLRSIGIDIKGDKATYNSLKTRYDAMLADYTAQRTAFETRAKALEDRKAEYESNVDHWNENGGAPEKEYAKLEAEKASINTEISSINAKSKELNGMTETLNSLATVINQLITSLNLNVQKYNNTTKATAEEFDEGQYVYENGQARIDVYQFDNNARLIRVLAHELGHAIGLEHVDDPAAIMYKLNQSTNIVPNASDMAELEHICGKVTK